MIALERRLFGLVYERRLVYAKARDLTAREARPALNELVSLVACPLPLEAGPNCIITRCQLTTCVDLCRPIERVFKSLNATSRTAVRQAQKMADTVVVRFNDDQTRYNFLRLADGLRRSKGISRAARLSRTLNQYGGAAEVWAVYHENQALCAHVILRDFEAGKARLAYSATRRFEGSHESRLCGVLNRYLHWRELEHYQSTGIASYDFGGIDDAYQAPGANASHFKLSFGGAVQQEYSYLIAGMKTAGLAAVLLWQRITGHSLP